MSSPTTVSQWNYTEEELQALVGKSLLVGMTHCYASGATSSREQFYGIIERINLKEGIVVKHNGSDKERVVPLDFTDFALARPGEYRLTGTNEAIQDPDYTITVYVHSDIAKD